MKPVESLQRDISEARHSDKQLSQVLLLQIIAQLLLEQREMLKVIVTTTAKNN